MMGLLRLIVAAMIWSRAGAASDCAPPRSAAENDCRNLHPHRASSVLRRSACGVAVSAEEARGERAVADEDVEASHRSSAALEAARRVTPRAPADVARERGLPTIAYLAPAPESAFWRWRAALAASPAAAARGGGDNSSAVLVWDLTGRVGIGNALDALAGVVVEALFRGQRLVIKSPILSKVCALAACALVPAEGEVTEARGKRAFLDRAGRLAAWRGDRNFRWRFSRVPVDYEAFVARLAEVADCERNVLPTLVLSCLRSKILRDVVRGVAAGRGVSARLPRLRDAYVGSPAAFDGALANSSAGGPPRDDVGSLPRRDAFALGVHLRFLDFIEGRNASRRGDAAAVDWLNDCRSRVGLACLARRVDALLRGCHDPAPRIFLAADSAPAKRAFAVALKKVVPRASVSYLDVEPAHFATWYAPPRNLDDAQWWALAGALLDWYLLASADAQLSLRGTNGAAPTDLPSSYARSASLFAGVGRADLLADALTADGETDNPNDAHVRCCSWRTYRHW